MVLKAVLIDLSGTIHVENTAIAGAIQALKRLRTSNLFIRFVTNTTKDSKRILVERLTKIGFDVKPDEIFSSLSAARNLIETRRLNPHLMLTDDAMEDFQGLQCKDNEPNAVVVGLAPNHFQYEKMNEAFRHLRNGASLIAINVGKYHKRTDGMALGPGCFVKGLEFSAQCTAEVVGKPNKLFFQAALNGIDPSDAVMIGDDVTDDVKGAMDAGLQGFLVKTGKYATGDEKKIDPAPTAVCDDFSHAVDLIFEQIK